MNFSWVISLFRAANKDWTSRVFTLVLIASITYSLTRIFEAKSKVKDCTSCEKQRGELIQALIDIRTTLQSEQPVSSTGTGEPLIYFAMSFSDTVIPKQQQQVQKVLSKIDSILLKYKVPQQKQKTTI